MGLSENSDDHIYSRHKELCKDLNMDPTTTGLAWDSYESIRQHYTLEVSLKDEKNYKSILPLSSCTLIRRLHLYFCV